MYWPIFGHLYCLALFIIGTMNSFHKVDIKLYVKRMPADFMLPPRPWVSVQLRITYFPLLICFYVWRYDVNPSHFPNIFANRKEGKRQYLIFF